VLPLLGGLYLRWALSASGVLARWWFAPAFWFCWVGWGLFGRLLWIDKDMFVFRGGCFWQVHCRVRDHEMGLLCVVGVFGFGLEWSKLDLGVVVDGRVLVVGLL